MGNYTGHSVASLPRKNTGFVAVRKEKKGHAVFRAMANLTA